MEVFKMNDKIVILHKHNFTEDDWLTLSLQFGFKSSDTIAYIHVIEE
jgi:hypothetical protein